MSNISHGIPIYIQYKQILDTCLYLKISGKFSRLLKEGSRVQTKLKSHTFFLILIFYRIENLLTNIFLITYFFILLPKNYCTK